MASVPGPGRRRKKVLGRIAVVPRESYGGLDLDVKVELVRSLVPLGLLYIEELLDAEVQALAGERYRRKGAEVNGRRHGSNPGSVRLAGQRVAVRVPRVRGGAGRGPHAGVCATAGDGRGR